MPVLIGQDALPRPEVALIVGKLDAVIVSRLEESPNLLVGGSVRLCHPERWGFQAEATLVRGGRQTREVGAGFYVVGPFGASTPKSSRIFLLASTSIVLPRCGFRRLDLQEVSAQKYTSAETGLRCERVALARRRCATPSALAINGLSGKSFRGRGNQERLRAGSGRSSLRLVGNRKRLRRGQVNRSGLQV